MTVSGGTNGYGTLFEYDPTPTTTNPNGVFSKKVDFTGSGTTGNGSSPYGSLIVSGSKIYGMTNSGGANGF